MRKMRKGKMSMRKRTKRYVWLVKLLPLFCRNLPILVQRTSVAHIIVTTNKSGNLAIQYSTMMKRRRRRSGHERSEDLATASLMRK
jgi:hypothetical protein